MNIWTGLLFLEGAVSDVSLARELAREPDAGAAVQEEASVAHDALVTDGLIAGTGRH